MSFETHCPGQRNYVQLVQHLVFRFVDNAWWGLVGPGRTLSLSLQTQTHSRLKDIDGKIISARHCR